MNNEREKKIDTIAQISIAVTIFDFVMIATGMISPIAGITMLAPVGAALLSMHELKKAKKQK